MANNPNPGDSYLGPWGGLDKIKLILLSVACLLAIVCVTLPVGWVAVLFMVGLVYVWVPPKAEADSYIPDTRPFKLAQFFQAFKIKLRTEVLTPTVALGFGPPLRDDFHNLDASIFHPPTRLAAWWGILGAITLGVIDYLINPVLFPFWGGPYLSVGWIMWILSIPGWFVVIQAVAHIMRWRAESLGVIGATCAPATMIDKVWADISPKKVLGTAGSLAFIPVVAAGIAWVVVGTNIIVLLAVALFASFLLFFGVASRMMTKAYRAEWYKVKVKPITDWAKLWQVVRPKTPPQLVDSIVVPTKEEWAESHTPDEPYQAKIKMSTFVFTGDDSYASLTKGTDISPITKQVFTNFSEEDFKVTTAVLAPIGEVDHSNKKEMVGTVSKMGFRLYYSSVLPKFEDIFDPQSDKRWREFAVRAKLMTVLEREVSGGEDFVYIKSEMVTKPNSPQHIAEVVLKPPAKISYEAVNKVLDSIIASVEGVPWLRVSKAKNKKDATSENTNISIFLGDRPSEATRYMYRASGAKSRVLAADMSYIMAKNGVISRSATPPELIGMSKLTKDVSEALFKMPLGVDTSKMLGKELWKSLGASSGNEYLEIRTHGEGMEPGTFVMTMAEKNPLAAVFPFGDYADELVKGRDWKDKALKDPSVKKKPQPWDAWLKWGVGMFSNNKIGWDDFEKRTEPHLLLAGSSGSGKSVCLQSLILQLSVNNAPDDLVFWMVEPKIGLQRFKRMDNVERFVDSWYPYEDFFESVDELVEDAKQEMLRRNMVLSQYTLADGSVPEKLSQGRKIAHDEGDTMDEYGNSTPHSLKIPYLILIIEECGTLFADAPSKEDQEKQKRILANCARIAREGRSAGVYLICTTQYPTNASIPSVIRNQMGRVGLACRSRFASEIVIDEAGLEDPAMRLNKGSGMILDGLGYRQLRMFWLRDGDTTEGQPNDLVDFLGNLPKNSTFPPPGTPTAPAKKSASGKTGGKGKGKPAPAIVDSLDFTVPAPSSTVISRFNDATVEGNFVMDNDSMFNSKIDGGIATKDVTDADIDDLLDGV